MHKHIFVLATLAACTDPPPPAPALAITSPQRGNVQSGGHVTVTGTAKPASSGSPIQGVTVNGKMANVGADGSFSVDLDLPQGATLVETIAISQEGGKATDARAMQIGELHPIGTTIPQAVTAALSAETFTLLANTAGPIVKATDFNALLAPMQPMANLGDDIANVKLTITNVALGDVKFTLTPVSGGLQFSAELDKISVAANAAYSGALVIDGTTAIHVTADQVTIAGMLAVTPAGAAGFTTKIASPALEMTNLQLHADGLVGDIVDLLQSNLVSTIQDVATTSAESALEPLINQALGALAGPQQVDVLGNKLDLVAQPSGITFTPAGALVTMNISAKLEGSEKSPGYLYTPNGTPMLDVGSGVQLAIADDLMNEMLAEIHALGLLDIHVPVDVGIADAVDFKLTLPPMISANDGSLRLVLGDMIATVSDQGKPVVSAAVNAQVELEIGRGSDPSQIALQFGKVDFFVNFLEDSGGDSAALAEAAGAGLGVQVKSMSQFMITVPTPTIAGLTVDTFGLRADSGYLVASGKIH